MNDANFLEKSYAGIIEQDINEVRDVESVHEPFRLPTLDDDISILAQTKIELLFNIVESHAYYPWSCFKVVTKGVIVKDDLNVSSQDGIEAMNYMHRRLYNIDFAFYMDMASRIANNLVADLVRQTRAGDLVVDKFCILHDWHWRRHQDIINLGELEDGVQLLFFVHKNRREHLIIGTGSYTQGFARDLHHRMTDLKSMFI